MYTTSQHILGALKTVLFRTLFCKPSCTSQNISHKPGELFMVITKNESSRPLIINSWTTQSNSIQETIKNTIDKGILPEINKVIIATFWDTND